MRRRFSRRQKAILTAIENRALPHARYDLSGASGHTKAIPSQHSIATVALVIMNVLHFCCEEGCIQWLISYSLSREDWALHLIVHLLENKLGNGIRHYLSLHIVPQG